MTRQGAERAVVVSALVVAGTYTYRLLTEGHSSHGGSLLGQGAPPNLGRFITGWGFAFLVIAIITEAAPSLGGSVAILVAAGDVLANGAQVSADVNHKLGETHPVNQTEKGIAAGRLAGPQAPSYQDPNPGAGLAHGAAGGQVRR